MAGSPGAPDALSGSLMMRNSSSDTSCAVVGHRLIGFLLRSISMSVDSAAGTAGFTSFGAGGTSFASADKTASVSVPRNGR